MSDGIKNIFSKVKAKFDELMESDAVKSVKSGLSELESKAVAAGASCQVKAALDACDEMENTIKEQKDDALAEVESLLKSLRGDICGYSDETDITELKSKLELVREKARLIENAEVSAAMLQKAENIEKTIDELT